MSPGLNFDWPKALREHEVAAFSARFPDIRLSMESETCPDHPHAQRRRVVSEWRCDTAPEIEVQRSVDGGTDGV